MSITQIFLLAIIQGITEFLPVSSSGHLNLLHGLTDLPDQGIIIDVAVHGGTLLAVIIYFRHDVMRLIRGGLEILGLKILRPRNFSDTSEHKSAALQIIIATLPILPFGALLVLTGWIDLLRDPKKKKDSLIPDITLVVCLYKSCHLTLNHAFITIRTA